MRSTALFFFAVIAGTAAVLVPGLFTGIAARGNGVAVRMVVWGMPFEDRLFDDIYARRHEELNPHITVDYQRHSDVLSKYNAWHSAGEGAEVMRIGIDYYQQFIERGILEPLDEYINMPEPYGLSSEEMAAFPGDLMRELRYEGKLYGLPEDSAQYGLYYNKDIFDKYNKEHPDDPLEYPNADWTWDDLRDAAKKLTRRDEDGTLRVGGLDMPVWAWPFVNFFAQAGGELWSEDGLTTRVNGPAGIEALEFMRTLIIEDRSWQPYIGQDQGSGATARFATQRTAMMFGGSWWVPYFETNAPDLNFAVSPVPRGKIAAVPSGMVIWAMSSQAQHKLEGWRMIRWLVTEKQAVAYWDKLRVAPPANLNVLQSEAFRETSGIPKYDAAGNPIDGEYNVPPMPREKFDDRAKWLLHAWTPQADGETPSFVIAGRYQQSLQNELGTALTKFLSSPEQHDPQAILDDVARRVHEQIDRERQAKGLPTPDRDQPELQTN